MAAAADVAVVVALAVAPADEELGSATAADMMKQISCWGVGVLGILKGTRYEAGVEADASKPRWHKVGVGRSLIDDDGGLVWWSGWKSTDRRYRCEHEQSCHGGRLRGDRDSSRSREVKNVQYGTNWWMSKMKSG